MCSARPSRNTNPTAASSKGTGRVYNRRSLSMHLTNGVAIITGGKRIGRVVASELAARGMDLVLSYRGSKDEALATVADVEARGRKATTIVADVAKAADCEAIVAHAAQTFGRVDVLINMASIYM